MSSELERLKEELRTERELTASLRKLIEPLATMHNAYSDMPGAESKLQKQLEGLTVMRLEDEERKVVDLPVSIFAEASRIIGKANA